jgi:DDE superfamily endonuclease
MIGFARTLKRIMTRAALESGRITKSRQDGNREFISCLACVNALGKKIPPVLIYPGTSGDLWNTWVQDVTPEDEVFFTTSSNGWSSNAIGFQWLKQVFERYTQPARQTTKRLLLLDGHSSHVNMAFVDWADRHGIILLILPPHSTHRLQPLDVGLFQPLSTEYSAELDKLMNNSYGAISMSKALFYPMFKKAWDASFTKENIVHAFEKPGIWPIDAEQVLKVIRRPPKQPSLVPDYLKTPTNSRSIRQFQASYISSPTSEKRALLFHAHEKIAAELDIRNHQVLQLQESLEAQKKKNKKSKRLNLCGEEAGGPECWSPAKVVRARQFQEELEAKEKEEMQQKEERRVVRAKNKELREEKEAATQLRREQKAQDLRVRKAPKEEAKAVAKAPKDSLVVVLKIPKVPKGIAPLQKELEKPSKIDVLCDKRSAVVQRGDSTKRQIVLPQRFRD